MQHAVLLLFALALILCVALDLSILWALLFGLALFLFYGRYRGLGWRELLSTALRGVRTVRNILITFMLIGVLTAFWRAAGTIPTIVAASAGLIRPSVFLLMAFLLNGLVSLLTGTSFGTAATMGVICAAMGAAMGVDVRLTGGAVLSGAFFGDRCSPVSTSALLVAELTGTAIYDNIRRMLRSALLPFLLSCALYAALGALHPGRGSEAALTGTFARAFRLHWTALIPAAVILLLALGRVNVKLSMLGSIASAVPVALMLQRISPDALLRMAVFGYRAQDPSLGALLDGGGLLSMLRMAAIVCISASYAGLFEATGLLEGLRGGIRALSRRATPFAAMVLTGAVSAMVACNQTLAAMLTHQLCAREYDDPGDMALDMEDSVIVIAPLVPWSIASAVPLGAVGAPASSLPFALYLILLPLTRLAGNLLRKRRGQRRRSGRTV